jgi:hypothetical protein
MLHRTIYVLYHEVLDRASVPRECSVSAKGDGRNEAGSGPTATRQR